MARRESVELVCPKGQRMEWWHVVGAMFGIAEVACFLRNPFAAAIAVFCIFVLEYFFRCVSVWHFLRLRIVLIMRLRGDTFVSMSQKCTFCV